MARARAAVHAAPGRAPSSPISASSRHGRARDELALDGRCFRAIIGRTRRGPPSAGRCAFDRRRNRSQPPTPDELDTCARCMRARAEAHAAACTFRAGVPVKLPSESATVATPHQDRAARPQGPRPDRARRRGDLALLSARLSVRDVARPRHRSLGRRRQSLPRFRRRHRRLRDGPRASESRRGDAARRPAEFLHISSDFWHEQMIGLAERLAAVAPMGEPAMSFLCQSGTESVEGAIKLARYVTGRPRFIGFLGGFHGRTMGSLSFTSSKYTQQKGFAPTMPGVTHVPYPNRYRPLFAGAGPGQGGARLHPHAVRAQRAAVGSRGDPGRADPGRRRLPGAAARVSCRACARCATSTASC